MCNVHFSNSLKPTLTDGGLETTLIFEHGLELPYFAAFPLLRHPLHYALIADYYRAYLNIAAAQGTNFILESPTWRASSEWGFKLGYDEKELEEVNRLAIRQLLNLRSEYADRIPKIEISGCLGPRKDGYTVSDRMTASEARIYHQPQIRTLKHAGADMITILTVNYVDEGLGAVLAAMEMDVPIVVSFTVETDGLLPGGTSLGSAIETIDRKTGDYPKYYMINCAHPSHFMSVISNGGPWRSRIKGLRANASCKSHEELDNATELDSGDATDLARWYQEVKSHLPNLHVFGGCCGTSHHHVSVICESEMAHP